MLMRNVSGRALDVAGRVFPAGATVEVSDVEAGWLSSNPNFQQVPADPPATSDGDAAADPPADQSATKTGKKGKQ